MGRKDDIDYNLRKLKRTEESSKGCLDFITGSGGSQEILTAMIVVMGTIIAGIISIGQINSTENSLTPPQIEITSQYQVPELLTTITYLESEIQFYEATREPELLSTISELEATLSETPQAPVDTTPQPAPPDN